MAIMIAANAALNESDFTEAELGLFVGCEVGCPAPETVPFPTGLEPDPEPVGLESVALPVGVVPSSDSCELPTALPAPGLPAPTLGTAVLGPDGDAMDPEPVGEPEGDGDRDGDGEPGSAFWQVRS